MSDDVVVCNNEYSKLESEAQTIDFTLTSLFELSDGTL